MTKVEEDASGIARGEMQGRENARRDALQS